MKAAELEKATGATVRASIVGRTKDFGKYGTLAGVTKGPRGALAHIVIPTELGKDIIYKVPVRYVWEVIEGKTAAEMTAERKAIIADRNAARLAQREIEKKKATKAAQLLIDLGIDIKVPAYGVYNLTVPVDKILEALA